MFYTQEQRFWQKVATADENGCRQWKGSKQPSGYGQVRHNGKTTYAHRVAWILTSKQEIPSNKIICHTCDNRICCSPDHLYLGTHSGNISDMWERNPTPKEVLASPKAKLHAGEIWLIRKLKIPIPSGDHQMYKFSAVYISKMFKVSSDTILGIWKSDKWVCKEGYYI